MFSVLFMFIYSIDSYKLESYSHRRYRYCIHGCGSLDPTTYNSGSFFSLDSCERKNPSFAVPVRSRSVCRCESASGATSHVSRLRAWPARRGSTRTQLHTSTPKCSRTIAASASSLPGTPSSRCTSLPSAKKSSVGRPATRSSEDRSGSASESSLQTRAWSRHE